MLCGSFGDGSDVSTLKSACFSSPVLKLTFLIQYGQPIALVDPVATSGLSEYLYIHGIHSYIYMPIFFKYFLNDMNNFSL